MNKLNQTLTQASSVFAQIAVFLLKIMGALVMFMLYWMSDLMDNTFILDGSMGEKLQIIWIFVRNIVNVAFAIVLVVVAFINVAGFGAGEGSYALKKFLPKMAIALIAVNFTFLAARVILDVNNVLTTAVFALPQSVPDMGAFTAENSTPLKMYKSYKCSFNKSEIDEMKKTATGKATGEVAYVGGKSDTGVYQQGVPIVSFFDVCVAQVTGNSAEDFVEIGSADQIRTNNFAWVLATRYQGIQNIAKVPLDAKDWEALLINAPFSFIFGIIYAVAYLAMFIVLIVRVIVLWICIALSPLAAVQIAFPELLGEVKIGSSDIKTTFLDHAFVPLKMAIPMSIGFVMISQMSLVGLGDFSKEIMLTGGEFTRDGSIHRIMYGIASVALIWVGVFSATDKTMAKSMVDKIRTGVESTAKFVGKAPLQLVPIVPLGGGKSVSISSLGTAWEGIQRFPKDHAAKEGERVGKYFTGTLDKKDKADMAYEDFIKSGGDTKNEKVNQNVINNWPHMSDDKKVEILKVMADQAGVENDVKNATQPNDILGNGKVMDAIQREFKLTNDQITRLKSASATAGRTPTGGLREVGENLGITGLENKTGSTDISRELTGDRVIENIIKNPAHLAPLVSNENAKDIAEKIYEKIKGIQNNANKPTADEASKIMNQLKALGFNDGAAKDITKK